MAEWLIFQDFFLIPVFCSVATHAPEGKEIDIQTTMQANPEFSHRIGKTSTVVAEHNRLIGAADMPIAALPASTGGHDYTAYSTEIEKLPY